MATDRERRFVHFGNLQCSLVIEKMETGDLRAVVYDDDDYYIKWINSGLLTIYNFLTKLIAVEK